MYHRTRAYRISYRFILIILALLSAACILPIIHVLAVSFSGKAPTAANLVTFWPIDFTTSAYAKTLNNHNFIRSLYNTIVRVVLGTGLGMALTLLTAYPLSKGKDIFPRQAWYIWFFVITMLFSGGLLPSYILIQKLHLMDSIWSLVLPSLINVWNILLMLNFYRTLPKVLEEAALIDGAGQWKALFAIYIPLSMPAVATLSLFTVVLQWNSWFDGMIYMEAVHWPLATLLQSIIVQVDFTKLVTSPTELADISDQTVKASQILIGALPILVLYPLLQKFFAKGVVLGAIKE